MLFIAFCFAIARSAINDVLLRILHGVVSLCAARPEHKALITCAHVFKAVGTVLFIVFVQCLFAQRETNVRRIQFILHISFARCAFFFMVAGSGTLNHIVRCFATFWSAINDVLWAMLHGVIAFCAV